MIRTTLHVIFAFSEVLLEKIREALKIICHTQFSVDTNDKSQR